jgi:hypothetical protein
VTNADSVPNSVEMPATVVGCRSHASTVSMHYSISKVDKLLRDNKIIELTKRAFTTV